MTRECQSCDLSACDILWPVSRLESRARPCQGRGRSVRSGRRPLEGALAVEVQIFDGDGARLAVRPDREAAGARAKGVLADRLIGEDVAVEMTHRRGAPARPEP